MDTLQPTTLGDLVAIIAEGHSLDVCGLDSKRDIGHTVNAARRLSTRAMNQVLFYEPDEMVISVRAGTPLRTVRSLLHEHGQRLAFEPPDWTQLLGCTSEDQTIGGVVSTNLSGSRRLSAGACRDHVLGVVAVNGRAEVFKSGGRVVKNVTGYDLPKLLTGAWGTLGVVYELTLRTLPSPELEQTLLFPGVNAQLATELFTRALGGPWELVSAAWLPGHWAPSVAEGQPCAALRLEGTADSVADRLTDLSTHIGQQSLLLDDLDSRLLWQQLSDNSPMSEPSTAVWRVSVPPAAGAGILAELGSESGWLDWAGGLIWWSTPDRDDAQALRVRALLERCGGHATLIRAEPQTRARAGVFQPRPGTLRGLEQRIRAAFDPEGILNPGRMG